MKKDLTFLAIDGKLTSSSAAHLRDLAAAKANEILSTLNGMKFVDKFTQLIGTTERHTVQKGWCAEDIHKIPDLIEKVAQYHSFEAWMNEAIEAKRHLFTELNKLSIEDWAKLEDVTLPEEPKMEATLTPDEYCGEMTIKDRNHYFMLQAKVSAIGKLIHDDGYYARAIKEYQSSKSNPTTEILNGRDTILHSSVPSVDTDTINNVYFALQDTHRSYQAQINGMKDAMDTAIKKDTMEKTSKYREALSAYRTAMAEYQAQMTSYKQKMSAEMEKLKIVIPTHLMSIYTELSQLGK